MRHNTLFVTSWKRNEIRVVRMLANWMRYQALRAQQPKLATKMAAPVAKDAYQTVCISCPQLYVSNDNCTKHENMSDSVTSQLHNY